MLILNKGVKKMQDGDRGSVFFDALAANQQLQNDHQHNGTDGHLIDAKDLARGTLAVSSSSWLVSGTGYRKVVTMPAGYLWGSCAVTFFLNADGSQIFPKAVKINTTSFYLYMPVNDQAVDCLFT